LDNGAKTENGHVRHLIDAYLDGELELERSLAVEAHLAACAICRAETDARRATIGAVKAGAAYFEAPERLRRSIMAGIGAAAPAARRPPRSAPRWLAMAASLLVAIGLGAGSTYWMLQPGQSELVAQEIESSYVRSLLVKDRLIDVASSDEHTVKPWLNSRLDFSPPVQDFTTQGFTLVGGRLDYVAGRNVAVLVYRHRQHILNLMIWPEVGGGATPAASSARQGHNVTHWVQGGMTYWVISDLNPLDIAAFVALVRNAPPPTGRE
jgi:anti-sigma factor RsiW